MSDPSDSKPDNGDAEMAEQQPPKGEQSVERPPVEAPSESAAASSRQPGRRPSRNWISWLALLVSIAALALAGWLFSGADDEPDETGPDPAVAALELRLDGLQRSLRQYADQASAAVEVSDLRELESRINAVEQTAAEPDRQTASVLQRLERSEAELNRRLEAIQQRLAAAEQADQSRLGRLEQLETQLAARGPESGLSADRANVDYVALARVEDLLATARHRLELLGDVQTARTAWAEAIVQVERLDAAEFEGLLQRLRAERDALAAASGRDDAAEISALFAAADDVLLWSARPDTGVAEAPDPSGNSAADAGWRDRFGRVFDRLVRVERVDIQYLDPAELDAARRSLAALLETTALSLARRDDEVTARLAAEAQRRIRELFETSDPSIGALVQRLGTLASPQDVQEPRLDASTIELRRLIEAER